MASTRQNIAPFIMIVTWYKVPFLQKEWVPCWMWLKCDWTWLKYSWLISIRMWLLSIEIPLQSISITINQDQSLQEISDDAIHSAALSTEATATFMFLPSWNKRMTTNLYASLHRRFPHICKFLGSIPSDQFHMQKYPSGTIYRRHFPNTIGICKSLPYGLLKAETASMLATKNG